MTAVVIPKLKFVISDDSGQKIQQSFPVAIVRIWSFLLIEFTKLAGTASILAEICPYPYTLYSFFWLKLVYSVNGIASSFRSLKDIP